VNVVVAYAHPCAESCAAAIRDRVTTGLAEADHAVHLIDLYAMAYDPSLPLPPDDRAAVAAAGSLVLVHPTWWTSQPAILLGWIGQATETGLPSVRSIVTVTTHGGSRLANRIAGASGVRVISHAVRPRCAKRPPHRRLALYGLDRSTPQQRRAFLDRVERRIGTLVR
jgi:NAD(P)H dehydrogenase (quinone)